MKRDVFIDASAWVALGNKRDQYHTQAATLYDQILDEQLARITSTWVIYEALSILKSRAGYKTAEKLWERVNDPEVTQFVRVDEAIEDEALDLFFDHRDKDWGVVDCSSLIIMNKLGCQMAFAFDRHFSQAAKQYAFAILT
jgi:uncharacterized protein